MGHECLILLKIFTLLYLSKEVRKHKDTNDFRDAYCGERVQSSKLIARFTAHIDFTICVVSAMTLVITVIFSIRVCPMLCSLVATRCGVLVVSAPLKHSMHAVCMFVYTPCTQDSGLLDRHSLKRAWRICGASQTLLATLTLALLAPFRPLRASIVVATLALTAYAAFLQNWRRHVAEVANARLRKIHKQT